LVAAYDGQIGQSAYAASKGAIAAMTLPLAREFTHEDIRVMCIVPGVFGTPMMDNVPTAVQDNLESHIPIPP